MSPKIGRPPSENPKDKMIRVRMDSETIEKLDQCAESLETTRSEVIRMGIDRIADEIKK